MELHNAVVSAYSTDYAGLGCDKHPMLDFCQPNCAIQRKSATEYIPVEPLEQVQALRFWTWSALLKRELTPPEFIVDGLIPRRGVTIITGEGGIGKSFITLELAYSVATGSKFLSHFHNLTGPVIMIDLENDEASITRRAQKITAGKRESETVPDHIPVYGVEKGNLVVSELHIDQSKGREALYSSVENYCPCLLIVDPLIAIHSKDENDNGAMRQVIMDLQELARRFNLAVVVVHHPRKRGMINDAGQMMRGASDLRNAVDSHLFIRKVSKEHLIIEHDKSRHSPPVPKFTIEMMDNEDETATYIRYAGATSESLEKEAAAREAIISALTECKTMQRKDLIAIAELDGIAPRTAERALKNLSEEKTIISEKRGFYSLTQLRLEPE